MSKYLLNNLDENIRDHLTGLALSNPLVQITPPPIDAIVRKDIDKCRQNGQVLVVSGGGAGHEPMFAGFVGPNHLSAAISGSYFASPSAGSIVRLIRLVAPEPNTPILLVQANYTGDRLNFGLAKERLALMGYDNVGWFVFGDDLAPFLTSSGGISAGADVEIKRRGLAGITFVHKIAGTLAERGKSLPEIQRLLDRLPKLTFTLSVSLSAADIPGRGPSFQLGRDQMELGLGVHGESGIKRIMLLSANKTIRLMLNEMIGRLPQLNPGELPRRLAMIVNNLGGLIPMEMDIVLKEVIEQLRKRHEIVHLERLYHGPLFTSFNMRGVSLTMLLVDDELIDILDEADRACTSAKIVNTNYVYQMTNGPMADEIDDESNQRKLFEICCDPELYKRMLADACHSIISEEANLNQLDGTVGDSDCGSTLSAMAKLFLNRIADETNPEPPTFANLARIVTDNIGGTSGALYSLLLTAAHNFIESNADSYDWAPVQFWLRLVQHCMEKLSLYGGSQIGHRSMLDGLHGIVLGIQFWLEMNSDIQPSPTVAEMRLTPSQASDLALTISGYTESEAYKTANMKPMVGRAAYVDHSRAEGYLDAGAFAVAIWTEAIMQTFIQHYC